MSGHAPQEKDMQTAQARIGALEIGAVLTAANAVEGVEFTDMEYVETWRIGDGHVVLLKGYRFPAGCICEWPCDDWFDGQSRITALPGAEPQAKREEAQVGTREAQVGDVLTPENLAPGVQFNDAFSGPYLVSKVTGHGEFTFSAHIGGGEAWTEVGSLCAEERCGWRITALPEAAPEPARTPRPIPPVPVWGIPAGTERRRFECSHGKPLVQSCIRCDYDRRYYATAVNAKATTAGDSDGIDARDVDWWKAASVMEDARQEADAIHAAGADARWRAKMEAAGFRVIS